MKREDLYFLVILLAELLVIIILLWIATHSEFVTHAEFITAIMGIFAAMTAGFWALWSRISQLAEEIGYLRGRKRK
jgi:hypothetical protein